MATALAAEQNAAITVAAVAATAPVTAAALAAAAVADSPKKLRRSRRAVKPETLPGEMQAVNTAQTIVMQRSPNPAAATATAALPSRFAEFGILAHWQRFEREYVKGSHKRLLGDPELLESKVTD